MDDVVVRPVDPADLDTLASLFDQSRNTRHCFCMAFCTTRTQFGMGWLTGGNRRRFASLAADQAAPMGVIAHRENEAVGWCAVGPRSRYAVPGNPRDEINLRRLNPGDDSTWFVPCFFVAPAYRGQGLTRVLLDAAVDIARSAGASGIEGWPQAAGTSREADRHLGTEQLFASAGFTAVDRFLPDRVIMRLDLR